MFTLPQVKRKTSARRQIDIQGVRDGIIELRHHKYCLILRVSSLNFELYSEAEQDAIIDSYENFLNAIGCPLQVLIRTREVDMSQYFAGLQQLRSQESELIYRQLIKSYESFVNQLIESSRILSRHFYVIVPLENRSGEDAVAAREQTLIRADIITRGLNKLGIQTVPLDNLEALDLFYSFYSASNAKDQPLTYPTLSLLHKQFSMEGVRS